MLKAITRIFTLTALLAAVLAPAAEAACEDHVFSQVFSPWDDLALYAPAVNGDFEDGLAGWSTTGDARIVADTPGRLASHKDDVRALELPAGSTATSPPICVGSGYPSSRMFGRTMKVSPESGSTLMVEILYTDATRGGQAVKKLGSVPSLLEWNATRKMSIAQGQLNIKPDSAGATNIRYRFTPLYGTTWRIDDLYVDPRLRG